MSRDGRNLTRSNLEGGRLSLRSTSENGIQQKRGPSSHYRSMSELKPAHNYKVRIVSNTTGRHSSDFPECQGTPRDRQCMTPKPSFPFREHPSHSAIPLNEQIDELKRKMQEEAQMRLLSYEQRNERRRLREIRKAEEEAKLEKQRLPETLHEYQTALESGVFLRSVPHELSSNSTKEISKNYSTSVHMSNNYQQDINRLDFSLELMPRDKYIDPSDVQFKCVKGKVNTFIKQSRRYCSTATGNSVCNDNTLQSYAKELEMSHIRQLKGQSTSAGVRRYSTYGACIGNNEHYKHQPLRDVRRAHWNERDMSILHGATPKKFRILKLYNNKKYPTGDVRTIPSHELSNNQLAQLRMTQKHSKSYLNFQMKDPNNENIEVHRTSLIQPHPQKDTPLPMNTRHISRSSIEDTMKSLQTNSVDEADSNMRKRYHNPTKLSPQRLDDQETPFSVAVKPHEIKVLPVRGKSGPSINSHTLVKEYPSLPTYPHKDELAVDKPNNSNLYSPDRNSTSHNNNVRRPLFSPQSSAPDTSHMSLPLTLSHSQTVSPGERLHEGPLPTAYTRDSVSQCSTEAAYNTPVAHIVSKGKINTGATNSVLNDLEVAFPETYPDDILSPMTDNGEEIPHPLKTLTNNHMSTVDAQMELRASQYKNVMINSDRKDTLSASIKCSSLETRKTIDSINPQKSFVSKGFIRKDLFVPSLQNIETSMGSMTVQEGNVAELPSEPAKPLHNSLGGIRRLNSANITTGNAVPSHSFRNTFDRGTTLPHDVTSGAYLGREEIEQFTSVDDNFLGDNYNGHVDSTHQYNNNEWSSSNSPPQPNDPSRLLLRQLVANR